jgi:hypothetical protein
VSAPPDGIGETCEPPDDRVPGDGDDDGGRVDPEARDEGCGVEVGCPMPVAVAVGRAVPETVGRAVPDVVGRIVPVGRAMPLTLGATDGAPLLDGAGLADGVTVMMLVVMDVEHVTTLAPGFPVPLH